MLRWQPSPLALGIAFTACSAGFVALAIRAPDDHPSSAELRFAKEVQSWPGRLDDFFVFVNWLGHGIPLSLVTVTSVLLLLRFGYLIPAALLALSFIPRLLQAGIKELIDSPRPPSDVLIVREFNDTPAFPSGHVVGTAVVFVLLALYAPLLSKQFAGPLRLFSAMMIAVIGLARVWAGAHWPSDALGGYFFATSWLLLCLLVHTCFRWRYRGPRLAGSGRTRQTTL